MKKSRTIQIPEAIIEAPEGLKALFEKLIEAGIIRYPRPVTPKIPFNCAGVGIDFQAYPISITPGPLVANGIKVSDDDHVSGPPPTPTRIQLRSGYTALHCGYLLTIDMPPTEVVDLMYFDGGGIIDYFDLGLKLIHSKHVPNTPLPTTETFFWPAKIVRVEIRSANEMFLLQICCRKG